MATQETRQPILQAKGLYKRYGHVTAIDGADFELYPGEILAVIGDNGAGKSSLIKVLSGATIPDSGTVSLDGEEVNFKSPLEVRRAGIETVYQDLALSPALSIADNLFLGRELRKPGPFGKFFRLMLERGIYLAPSQFEAAFLSAAHTEEDIAKTVAAAQDSFEQLRSS